MCDQKWSKDDALYPQKRPRHMSRILLTHTTHIDVNVRLHRLYRVYDCFLLPMRGYSSYGLAYKITGS